MGGSGACTFLADIPVRCNVAHHKLFFLLDSHQRNSYAECAVSKQKATIWMSSSIVPSVNRSWPSTASALEGKFNALLAASLSLFPNPRRLCPAEAYRPCPAKGVRGW